MDQAAFEDQKVLGNNRERSAHSDLFCYMCYCLVAIIQHDMHLTRSTYEVLQILSISLTDKTHLRDLLESTNVQYDKDRCDLDGQLSFNF